MLKESVGIDSDLGRETWVIGEPTLLAGLPRERGIGMVATDVSAEWLVMGQPALEEPESGMLPVPVQPRQDCPFPPPWSTNAGAEACTSAPEAIWPAP